VSRQKVSQIPDPETGALPGVPPTNGSAIGRTAEQIDLLTKTRCEQNYADHIKTRRKAVTVPIHNPDKQAWIFIHPDPAWHVVRPLLVDKINRRTYVVMPQLEPEVADDLKMKKLVTYATRQGSINLWPISMPDEFGFLDSWSESAQLIVAESSGQWIRVKPDRAEGTYYTMEMATNVNAPVPKWPESFSWVFNTAFKNRLIERLDHPILRALREGENDSR
jgi:hypothetical protein